MDSVTLSAREMALKQEGEKLLSTAAAEGRKLTADEETRFAQIEKEQAECRANRESIEKRLAAFSAGKPLQNAGTAAKTVTMNVGEERAKFSLLEAIANYANGRGFSDKQLDVLNRGKEQMNASGLSFSGQIQMPVDFAAVGREARALDGVITGSHMYTANTYNGGKEAVRTDVLDIITGLRGNTVLAAAGSTYMTGLVGNVQIPVYSGSTVGWNTEVANASNGTGTFADKTLSPKRVTGYFDISKQFLIQTAETAEALLRSDIVNAITAAVETALLTTTAVSNAPAPIALTDTDITTAADWWGLIAALEGANFYGDFRCVLSPSLKQSLRSIKLDSGSGRFLFENGFLDGYPTFVSTNVASGLGFAGVFPELIIGQWGAVDITVDPVTQAVGGKVRIVVNAYFDAIVRRDGAIKAFEYVAPAEGGGGE